MIHKQICINQVPIRQLQSLQLTRKSLGPSYLFYTLQFVIILLINQQNTLSNIKLNLFFEKSNTECQLQKWKI
ncbi:hypothetical protein MIR68_007416 [Amoeboaphelidium protococcarum]|nr:hypothetical protein MIR68_007416 [Amoeboaphelidium protococcarum]